MKNTILKPTLFSVITVFALINSSCGQPNAESIKTGSTVDKINISVKKETKTQIGEYVTGVYEDSKGNLWFGTLKNGIAKYDGNKLKYYSKKDGLPSDRVTGIIEDENGVYWLKSTEGLIKFNGKTFTNFPIKKDDFYSNMVRQLLIDSKGIFWIGTWGGVYKFNGEEFIHFPIPYPKVTTVINQDTKNWISEIKEDSEGNIWFGRDGYGACKFDGKSFTHFLKKDGLHSNNITEIEFDKDGDIWFGTRVAEYDNPDPTKRIGKGGINKMTKNEIISFPEIEGFNNGDVFEIYKDDSDNIWISTIKNGVYKFNGNEFKHYDVPISIMSMMNDKKGNLWLGGAGGLYRINPNGKVENITINGPWQ